MSSFMGFIFLLINKIKFLSVKNAYWSIFLFLWFESISMISSDATHFKYKSSSFEFIFISVCLLFKCWFLVLCDLSGSFGLLVCLWLCLCSDLSHFPVSGFYSFFIAFLWWIMKGVNFTFPFFFCILGRIKIMKFHTRLIFH